MRDSSRSIQDQFGQVAANYRTSVVHAEGAELERMRALAAELGNPYALDAGCGAGHTSVAIAPACREVVAFDLTDLMLAQVEQLAVEKGIGNIRTEQGDVAQLPFPDATFDLVASRYSAHHWLFLHQALAECRRVLRPAGRFLLCDIIAPEDLAVDTFLQTLEYLRDPSHVRDHRLSEWEAQLAATGFQIDKVTQWHLDLQLDRWTQRMNTPPVKVAMLRQLMAEASAEATRELRLRPDGWFAIPATLIEATAV